MTQVFDWSAFLASQDEYWAAKQAQEPEVIPQTRRISTTQGPVFYQRIVVHTEVSFARGHGVVEYVRGEADESAIPGALEGLRAHIRNALGDAVIDFAVEHVEGGEDDDESIKYIDLVATLKGVPRDVRHRLMAQLLAQISASPSEAVRERVTVTFR